ncbi:MAG: ribonuclease P protein component [Tissierellia bacterium]|nr:ribonuclease P protein component [Tissierellia bacterium]
MKKKFRLRKNEDFQIAYKEGKKYWNRNLILYKRKNGLDYSRIGFSINKKFGNSVERNRAKRRMREICRLNFHNFRVGYDIIIIPKKNVINIGHKELNSAMLHIFKIAHLLRN